MKRGRVREGGRGWEDKKGEGEEGGREGGRERPVRLPSILHGLPLFWDIKQSVKGLKVRQVVHPLGREVITMATTTTTYMYMYTSVTKNASNIHVCTCTQVLNLSKAHS